MEEIDVFIDQILTEKGVVDLKPEIEKEVKADMKKRLLEQIDKAAVMQLSEEQAAELADKVSSPDFTNEDAVEFMKNSGVNLTQVAFDTMLRFRGLYLGNGE